ncbi:MAG: hypothetical protein AUJ07_03530 [Crenarchaeota archaeon 13_1_40CM_3_53_5]|nr:MAG: hypothetical protein AUJ07_03530 [Crenarchaeota archaeon 13_1_40CM_3_53_5]
MPSTPNTRSLVIYVATTYLLFLVGTLAVLVYVLPLLPGRFVHIEDKGLFIIELGGVLTVLVPLIAIPLGFRVHVLFWRRSIAARDEAVPLSDQGKAPGATWKDCEPARN